MANRNEKIKKKSLDVFFSRSEWVVHIKTAGLSHVHTRWSWFESNTNTIDLIVLKQLYCLTLLIFLFFFSVIYRPLGYTSHMSAFSLLKWLQITFKGRVLSIICCTTCFIILKEDFYDTWPPLITSAVKHSCPFNWNIKVYCYFGATAVHNSTAHLFKHIKYALKKIDILKIHSP